MRHPVQRLYYCASNKFLYAGIAGTIQVFDSASGILLRQWEAPELPTIISKKQKQQQRKEEFQKDEKEGSDGSVQMGALEIEVPTGDEEGVAVKKRKVDDITASPKVAPAAAPAMEGKSLLESSQKRKKLSFREAPGMGGWSATKGTNLVTNIVGTNSGRHLVVATNEDKTLRVFGVSELAKGRNVWAAAGGIGENVQGELQLLSERQMPKRLCAIQLLEKKQSMTEEEEAAADGVVIICADKFGDVYSLPLIHTPDDKKGPTPETSTPASISVKDGSSATPEPERKVPRDTGIITTERNKRAAKTAGETKTRSSIANLEAKELQFKHKLLLGHVSLLLDVVPITLEVELSSGEKKKRTWIVSADKDEHIRVTRYPQSYIIEGFCLEHTSYVAKLLAPSWDKKTLISGGGDDYLIKWDWQAGVVEQKLDLKEHVGKVLAIVKAKSKTRNTSTSEQAMDVDPAEGETNSEEEFQISVTGLWEFADKVQDRNQVLVSVEGVPAIFVFTQRATGTYEFASTVGVSGNVLDVAVVEHRILVSVDPQSTPFPIVGEEGEVLVECLEPQSSHLALVTSDENEKLVTGINSKASWEIAVEQKAKLDEFIYGAKHLRKFEGEGAEKGGD